MGTFRLDLSKKTKPLTDEEEREIHEFFKANPDMTENEFIPKLTKKYGCSKFSLYQVITNSVLGKYGRS